MAQPIQMTLDTEQVMSIAAQLESDNIQLKELLESSKTAIQSLSSVWTGQAADETISSYETFSNKFNQLYYDILDQYVKFLRTNVAEQYTQVELTNTSIADAFK